PLHAVLGKPPSSKLPLRKRLGGRARVEDSDRKFPLAPCVLDQACTDRGQRGASGGDPAGPREACVIARSVWGTIRVVAMAGLEGIYRVAVEALAAGRRGGG